MQYHAVRTPYFYKYYSSSSESIPAVPRLEIVQGIRNPGKQEPFLNFPADSYQLHIFNKVSASNRGKSDLCMLCVEGVDMIRMQANSTRVRALAKSELKALCTETGSLSSQCQQYVDQYFDVLYDELLRELVKHHT